MKFLHRLSAAVVIRIGDAGCSCLKGSVMHRTLADIADIAAHHGVRHGEIWLQATGKARFSQDIPAAAHQQLRNVLASR